MADWKRPTRMVNGSPGVYTMERSPLEIAVVCVLLTAVLGFGGWTTITQIQLGRELSSMGGDLRALHGEVAFRVERGMAEHASFRQSDADIALRLAEVAEAVEDIELRLAAFQTTSGSNQRQAIEMLKNLPPAKEKRK